MILKSQDNEKVIDLGCDCCCAITINRRYKDSYDDLVYDIMLHQLGDCKCEYLLGTYQNQRAAEYVLSKISWYLSQPNERSYQFPSDKDAQYDMMTEENAKIKEAIDEEVKEMKRLLENGYCTYHFGDTPIEELNRVFQLGDDRVQITKLLKLLTKAKYETIEELSELGDETLMRIPGIGKGMINLLDELLTRYQKEDTHNDSWTDNEM